MTMVAATAAAPLLKTERWPDTIELQRGTCCSSGCDVVIFLAGAAS
jgi:hypothetical protein